MRNEENVTRNCIVCGCPLSRYNPKNECFCHSKTLLSIPKVRANVDLEPLIMIAESGNKVVATNDDERDILEACGMHVEMAPRRIYV